MFRLYAIFMWKYIYLYNFNKIVNNYLNRVASDGNPLTLPYYVALFVLMYLNCKRDISNVLYSKFHLCRFTNFKLTVSFPIICVDGHSAL
jgi:hypothetical protein